MSIIKLNGKEFRISGKFVRVMSLREELLDTIEDPNVLVSICKERNISADILTFTQHLPDLSPKFVFHMEWDNIAAVPISTYEEWLMNQVSKNTRKKVKKAQKIGVSVSVVNLDRKLAEGMVEIFNETPVRRGKLYPYFGKNAEEVEKEWSPDLERSDFVVAYFKSEIIGFIKLLYSKAYARASGTITKLSHRDKSPMNALLAKAVEICADKKIPYLIYGKYVYGRKGEDSLTAFKRHNGFRRIDVPRYYIPLSLRGKIGLKLGLHHGLSGVLPDRILRILSRIRSLWYSRMIKQK